MSLLREWARRACKEGLDGRIISQILTDEDFEENILEGIEIVASGAEIPDVQDETANGTRIPGETVNGSRIPNVPNPHDMGETSSPRSRTSSPRSRTSSSGSRTSSPGSETITPGLETLNEDTGKAGELSEGELSERDGLDQEVELIEATTSDFGDLVGDTSGVKRAMIKEYSFREPVWKKFARIVPLRDMNTVKRLRKSHTDHFELVPQGAEFGQGNFTSWSVSYAPKKYERGLNFTWEMLINDDLGAFRKIGTGLGRSAQGTVSDFATGFIRNNSAIYDGLPLFHADHGNIGSDPLSETSLGAAFTSMRTQASEKGNTLLIKPGFLLVPPELEFMAKKLMRSKLVPGAGTNDANVLKGLVEVVVDPLLADPDNWYLVAKPSSCPTIEIGFLAGRESPEIYVWEDYERDMIQYKGRVVFGGAVLDYRGFYGSIVG